MGSVISLNLVGPGFSSTTKQCLYEVIHTETSLVICDLLLFMVLSIFVRLTSGNFIINLGFKI